MKNSVHEAVEKGSITKDKLPKRILNWRFGIGSVVVAGAFVLGGIAYYQSNHFNSQISINGTNVGGLTAAQALQKLEASVSKNQVYISKTLVLDEGRTKTGFTDKDLPIVQKVLSAQRTFLPVSKVKSYSLLPADRNRNKLQSMKNLLGQKLTALNKNLKAPQDAQVQLQQGKIVETKSVPGTQYDVAAILQEFKKQETNSIINLHPVYIQPVKENAPILKKEKATLQTLLGRTVKYTVQNKVYALKGSELIKSVSLTKNMDITIDTADIVNKLNKINAAQSTLNKSFQFKTNKGSVITVKGQTYGWALNVSKEAQTIKQAFEKGQTSVAAARMYGTGWNTGGVGYQNTTNGGIGDTYMEVSIAQQRIWLYKNGQMVLTSHVVTGRHDVGEDTHPGAWYIMYKQSPAILAGSEVGNANYHVPVAYWAPFTMDGEGFHDAGWRTNWSNTAYLHQGSGGCVNTPPSVMKAVYDNLSQYEPVIVY